MRLERQRHFEELDSILVDASLDISALEKTYSCFEGDVRGRLRQSPGNAHIPESVRKELFSIRKSVEKYRNKFAGKNAEFEVLQSAAKNQYGALRKRVETLRKKLCELERLCDEAEKSDTTLVVRRHKKLA